MKYDDFKHISEASPMPSGKGKRDDNRYSLEKQLVGLVKIAIEEEAVEHGYLARRLFHTMLPHSAKEAREWSRSNGRVSISMQSGIGVGLPYGVYPRLIFAWICTEAVRTQSRYLVLGDSLNAFMSQLGLIPTGGRWGSITMLREQMKRLLRCRIMVEDNREGEGDSGGSYEFAREWDLWWDPRRPKQNVFWESNIVLGEGLYKELVNSPFPVDMRILREVKRSALGIDLYTWLTYRVSYLREPVYVSWRQLHDQFGADYNSKSGLKEFARAVKSELVKIKIAWPGLQYETPRGRLLLKPSLPSVPPAELPR